MIGVEKAIDELVPFVFPPAPPPTTTEIVAVEVYATFAVSYTHLTLPTILLV